MNTCNKPTIFILLPACPPGWYGGNCSDPCPSGWFGIACAHKCQNCTTDECDAVLGCEQKNGNLSMIQARMQRLLKGGGGELKILENMSRLFM